MKRTFVAISIILVLAFVGIFIMQSVTEAQRQDRPRGERGQRQGRQRSGGGPGAMIQRFLGLQESWWGISLVLDISDEQLVEARKIYQEARKKEGSLRKNRPQNREELIAAVNDIQTGINQKLKELLTEEQFTKYMKREEKRQAFMKRLMERRPRGEGEGRRRSQPRGEQPKKPQEETE